MTEKDKQRSADAMWRFIESVAVMLADDEAERERLIDRFPEPTGLGTDGTAWTVEEHRANYATVCRVALKMFSRHQSNRSPA